MIKWRNNLAGKIVALALFVVLLFIVVYKAIYIPITHDEKSAAVYYAWMDVGQIIMSDIWPSNHILNSLLIKVCENIFGMEPWSVRLPNILAFILFYGIVYLMAVRYFGRSWILFCLPFFIIFCNPFLLDFFGLARGYGLSNALMVCSVYFLLLFSSQFKIRWYYFTLIFAALAAYANFTLLIYWAAVQMLLACIFLIHANQKKYPFRKITAPILLMAVIGVSFLGLSFVPLYKMQSTNQFVYWEKDGFFKNTLLDQVYQFGYSVHYFNVPTEYVAKTIIVILFLVGLYVGSKIISKRQSAFSDPLLITFLLLIAVWAVNMLQSIFMGTPYLTTRTALSYYVLFSFVLLFLLRDLSTQIDWFKYTIVPLVIIIFACHLHKSVSFDYVREWKYDADTYKVMKYMERYQQKHPEIKKIDLNTTWIYNPSFEFYCTTGKTPWINLTAYHKEVDTTSQTLFYYATHDDAWRLQNYSSVLDFPFNDGVLLINKHALE